ncbi:alpha-galactosidase [Micromonospora haikouensis]|uniref:Alpha-galactosidase n=1 Tax=Micromonospora haikouensis TaxID=686309 RepID=A0A0D0UR82_9ACTN|nr:alpha-galactosidase [Micromonospora haikouensis]KIR61352.1 alpha-galactosidase [Micromonospora haikouensis]
MPLVESSPDGATVVLHTRTGSYAVRLDHAAGAVRPLHWGEPITVAAAAELPLWQPPYDMAFEGPYDGSEDFPFDGGRRFGPRALGIRYADGTGGLDLTITGHHLGPDTLVVDLADRAGPVAVHLHYRVAADTDVIERWSAVRHTGTDQPLELTDHAAAVWCLPPRDDYRLSHVTGGWCREGRLHRTAVPVAETTLTSRRGMTSHSANPWVMIDDGTTEEENGEVFSAALAFSGSWRVTVLRTHDGPCSLLGAAGHDRVTTPLPPGTTVTSPVFAAQRTTGGFGAASRAWHDYQRRRILPHPDEDRPVLYNSWEATEFDVSETGQRRLAELAARLGAELFVVDDGWFGARTNDRAGLGDWFPNPARFPDGLRPLADHVRSLGMRFGLWVEPEMVNPDSDLYRAHPDWVLHLPTLPATEGRNQLVLDYTRADVREWALSWLDDLVRSCDLAFLKWDCNRPFTEARPQSWIGHALGVYEVLDRLRERHPRLRIEACSSGGGRVDLGALARTDQVWTSDNTDAVDRLSIQHGYGQLYAPETMVAWVTDSPNPLTGREVPLEFRFHVAMSGVLGIGGDLATWSDADLATAAGLVGQYKSIRPVIQHGDLYRLTGPEATVTASAYVAGGAAAVFVWRVPGGPAETITLPLPGLDPGAVYRDATGRQFHGAGLRSTGLPVTLAAGPMVSALVTLERA